MDGGDDDKGLTWRFNQKRGEHGQGVENKGRFAVEANDIGLVMNRLIVLLW
jgi:hypothetical protein